MLIEDGECVRQCGKGFYHDVNKDTRICEKCPLEGCPKGKLELDLVCGSQLDCAGWYEINHMLFSLRSRRSID